MSDRAKIHIDITSQDTTAKFRCDGVGVSGYVIAVLYDIYDLKPFPMFSKVRFCGKEEWFHCNPEKGMLICKDAKPLDFWIGKQNKESEDNPILHKVTVTKTEEKVLEEYFVMRAVKNSNFAPNKTKQVFKEKECNQQPTHEEIAKFLSDAGADFVSVEHNYRFEPDLPFC